MKTAGLTLDFYDDANGELLKRSFPTPEALPEVVKEAHILSSEEREVLRDEAYALVMLNDGKAIRKFACVDPGNTFLSALYFTENAEALPEEVQKIAAANILAFCHDFGIEVPSLEKIAAGQRPPDASGGGAMRKRDSFRQPVAGDDANWAERTNLNSVRGGADSGRVIPTASQMKTAEACDEHGLPDKKSKGKKINFLDSHHKLNPGSKPEVKKVANAIDVSTLQAPVLVKKASAKHTALGHYSLDSFKEVETAVQFFEENWRGFTPSQRHEYAVKTASRADELGIDLTPTLARYGSTEMAPDLEDHLANRRALAPDHKEVWDTLQEKSASIAPDVFVELLTEADEVAGLNWLYGGEVADPFYATFGGNKAKEASAAWSWMSSTGDYVTAEQLKKLARDGRPMVEKQFDASIASAFSKNPMVIFDSLPDTHKTILARLAAQEHDGLINN